jgi:hypothetical protein
VILSPNARHPPLNHVSARLSGAAPHLNRRIVRREFQIGPFRDGRSPTPMAMVETNRGKNGHFDILNSSVSFLT